MMSDSVSGVPAQGSELAHPAGWDSLLPRPQGVRAESASETFSLTAGTGIIADAPLLTAARLFAQHIADGCGVALHCVDAAAPLAQALHVSVRFIHDDSLTSSYSLAVDAVAGIEVRARDAAGAFSAVATLRQLAGVPAFRRSHSAVTSAQFAVTSFEDSPRFGWRGVLLDVARHFMPKHDVLRYLDQAHAHKFNVVHLHLTDDQGWRVEIKRYPRLTEVGSWRTESNVGPWRHNIHDGRPHGGFYTQEDLREIVAYAHARGITVLPEIDVPGHAEAAIAAYPELGCALEGDAQATVRTSWGISTNVLRPNWETLEFFKNVFDELMDIFDGPFIGLGGDEVPPLLWREDETVVAFAREQGMDSVDELHGWFLGKLGEFVVSRGRRPVVWDEGVSEHLPLEAVVTTWRGYVSGANAMAQGYDIVLAPEQDLYLDHRAAEGDQEPIPVGFVRTLEDVLAFEPDAIPHFENQGEGIVENQGRVGRLLGIQAQLWSEQLDSPRRVDYAAFPRLCAVAEVAWSPKTDRSQGTPASAEFVDRLVTHHLPRLEAAGVEYRPLDGPLPWQQRPGVSGWPRDLNEEIEASGSGEFVGGWHEGMELHVSELDVDMEGATSAATSEVRPG